MQSPSSDNSLSPQSTRRCLKVIIESKRCETGIAVVILFNMFVIILETDAASTKSPVPKWIHRAGFALLGMYILELIAKLSVFRAAFFRDGWNVMDFLIVGSDVVLIIIDQVTSNMPKVSALRVLRLVRLVRAFKAASMFKELEMLLRGFVRAFKAIFWGVILVILMLTIWSILAVQLIHPLNKEVAATGVYGDCERCARAFETTFQSLLTFFQTVVAGDSWGQVAVPIVENFPRAGPFFLAVLVSVSLAIMNLILAVIVDHAQDSRDSIAKDQDEEDYKAHLEKTKKFVHICTQMDVDSSGNLTKEEVLDGLQNPEYAKLVGTHHLNRHDLEILIDSMADQKTHVISNEDVVAMLNRLRNPDNMIILLELAKLQLKLQEHIAQPALQEHNTPTTLLEMKDQACETASVLPKSEQPAITSAKCDVWDIKDDLIQDRPLSAVRSSRSFEFVVNEQPLNEQPRLQRQVNEQPLKEQPRLQQHQDRKPEQSPEKLETPVTSNDTEVWEDTRKRSKPTSTTFRLLSPWSSAPDDDLSVGDDDQEAQAATWDGALMALEEEDEPMHPKQHHPLIVTPNSKRRLVWDLSGVLLLGWDMVLIPLTIGFQVTGSVITFMGWLSLCFWTVDIPSAFFLAYYNKAGELVVDPWRIAWNYAKTWLTLDLIIVLMDWALVIVDGQPSGIFRLGKMLRAMRILRVLRLVRLAKLKQVMIMVQDRLDSEFLTIGLSVCKLMLMIVAINHFIACAWFKLGSVKVDGFDSWVYKNKFDQDPFIYQYLSSLHWSLTQFTPASMSVQPLNIGERLFAVLILLFAMIVFSSFVSSITAAMNQLRNLSAKNGSQLWLLRKFLREQNIDGDLYMRLVRYATVTSERITKRVQQQDVHLLKLLSVPLKSELTAALFRPIVMSYPLFERLSRRCPSLTNRMCACGMKPMSVWRGDILFHAQEEASGLYRMTQGKVRYVHRDAAGKLEIKCVTEKCWLAEAALWVSWVHIGTLQALHESNIFHLDASKFRELVTYFPTQLPYLKLVARNVLERLTDESQDAINDMEADFEFLHASSSRLHSESSPTASTSL